MNAPPSTLAAPARSRAGASIRFDGSDRLEERAFTCFAFLWAIATLFHQIAYPARHVGFFRYALTLVALWLLLRPSSLPRFLTLITAQLALVAYYTPLYVTNHWLFTSFVNLTILAALGSLLLRKRSLAIDPGELLRTFAPAVRLELLILYFYATFHKLNTDFLNPAVSCAADHYFSIATRFTLLPTGSWVHPLLIYGTLLIEGAIPLLLFFRRTRVAGVLLALGFHFLLALNPVHRFYNFSAMVYAVYFLFLPFDYLRSARVLLERSRLGRTLLTQVETGAVQRGMRRVIVAVAVVLLVLFALRFQPANHSWITGGIRMVNPGIWTLYAGTLLVIFVAAAWRWDLVRTTEPLVSFVPRPRVLLLLPLLVFLNGLSPYLGLKTETSFAMFSNLHTEVGRWNHLFIPASVKLFSYQEDVVRIVEASRPSFMRLAQRDRQLPYIEFRRRAARYPEMSITYIRNGEERFVPQVGSDPELSEPLPLLTRKLLHFRASDVSDVGVRCSH